MSAKEWDAPEGVTLERETLTVRVEVVRDERGRVSSSHDLATPEDRALALTWPTGGLEQVAFALTNEAVHREALFDVILRAGIEPKLLERLGSMSPEEREAEVAREAARVTEMMSRTLTRLSRGAVRAAFDHLAPPHR